MASVLRARGKRTRAAKVAGPSTPRQRVRDELQTIPGIGPAMAQDLRDLGIHRISQLRQRDPERLYRRLITLRGEYQDRCVLYVFRCAVYFAETAHPKAELLKWWNWKDSR